LYGDTIPTEILIPVETDSAEKRKGDEDIICASQNSIVISPSLQKYLAIGMYACAN
jgi:hypothetical protein